MDPQNQNLTRGDDLCSKIWEFLKIHFSLFTIAPHKFFFFQSPWTWPYYQHVDKGSNHFKVTTGNFLAFRFIYEVNFSWCISLATGWGNKEDLVYSEIPFRGSYFISGSKGGYSRGEKIMSEFEKNILQLPTAFPCKQSIYL